MSEQKIETTDSAGGSTRWWEFYAVRYAMGTAVGAVVFYFLCSATPTLRPLLLGITETPKAALKLETAQIILLAAYGLVYCYIASAPILVLHAGRFLLKLNPGPCVWLKRLLLFLGPPFILCAVAWSIEDKLSFYRRSLLSLAFFLVLFIVWLQYVVAVLTLWKNETMFLFYQELAERRQASRGGIIDSYRHLREHGNSFFIVLLEILLGIALVFSPTFLHANFETKSDANTTLFVYISILVVWIIPAVLVWLAATLFERRFSEQRAAEPADGSGPP